MRKKSPDYDLIADDYDLRYQQDHHQGTWNALRGILSEETPDWVLEVGSGTCYWLRLLSAFENIKFIGIDKSHRMLLKASANHQIMRGQGTAEFLPIKDETFKFVYCVNAIHHFSNPKQFIMQVNRVLKPGGIAAVIGMNPRDHRNKWYIYDFFQGTLQRDLERIPDWKLVELWLEEAGFINIHLQDVDRIHDPKSRETVMNDPFLEKTACSQLALLSEKQYQKGLVRLQQHTKNNPDPNFLYENDIVLSMMRARKPRG